MPNEREDALTVRGLVTMAISLVALILVAHTTGLLP